MSTRPPFDGFPRTNFLFNDGKLPRTVVKRQLLSPEQLARCLEGPLVVEEKLDGSCTGLSFSDDGVLYFQGKTKYLGQKTHPQHHIFFNWAWTIRDNLWETLGPGRILHGEWLLAKHTMKYTELPAYFVAFDIYERPTATRDGWFWTADSRDAILTSLGIPSVPRITVGSFKQLNHLLTLADGPSAFGSPTKEGVYVRLEQGGQLSLRAKYVRPEFRQKHLEEDDWASYEIRERNELRGT